MNSADYNRAIRQLRIATLCNVLVIVVCVIGACIESTFRPLTGVVANLIAVFVTRAGIAKLRKDSAGDDPNRYLAP